MWHLCSLIGAHTWFLLSSLEIINDFLIEETAFFHFALDVVNYVAGLPDRVVSRAAHSFCAILPSCSRTVGSHTFWRSLLGEGLRQLFLCVLDIPGTVPGKTPSFTSLFGLVLGYSQR